MTCMPDDERMLTVAEVAEVLACSVDTVDRLIKAEVLECVQVARRGMRRVPAESLAAYKKRYRVAGRAAGDDGGAATPP